MTEIRKKQMKWRKMNVKKEINSASSKVDCSREALINADDLHQRLNFNILRVLGSSVSDG